MLFRSADASVGLSALQSAVEKAGYAVGESSVSLAIDGMTCASCVSRVEKALMRVPGRSEERRVGKEGRSRWSPDH